MEKAMKIIRGTKIVAIIGILIVILGLWLPCKGIDGIDSSSDRKSAKKYGLDVQPQGIDSWEGQIIFVCVGLTVFVALADVLEKGVKSESLKKMLKKISDMRFTIVFTAVSVIMLILYAALKDTKYVDYYVHVGYFFMWIGEVILALGAFVYNPKKVEETTTPVEKTEE